jgi:WD40 repeat protein
MGGRASHVLTGDGGPVAAIAFARDGLTLASQSEDSRIRIWDVATGELLHSYPT